MTRDEFVCPRRMDAPSETEKDFWRFGDERWNIKDGHFPLGHKWPRTCSYCGGVHPDDAIDLLIEGWALEETDKHYKFYMEPGRGLARPVPPVKLYLMHFDWEQTARADDVIRGRRAFDAAHSKDDLTN